MNENFSALMYWQSLQQSVTDEELRNSISNLFFYNVEVEGRSVKASLKRAIADTADHYQVSNQRVATLANDFYENL